MNVKVPLPISDAPRKNCTVSPLRSDTRPGGEPAGSVTVAVSVKFWPYTVGEFEVRVTLGPFARTTTVWPELVVVLPAASKAVTVTVYAASGAVTVGFTGSVASSGS